MLSENLKRLHRSFIEQHYFPWSARTNSLSVHRHLPRGDLDSQTESIGLPFEECTTA